MTTRRTPAPVRTSLFPRSAAEAAQDACAAAGRAVAKTRAERLSAACVAAGRAAVARRPALQRAARSRTLSPAAPRRPYEPQLPPSEAYGYALCDTLGGE